MAYCPSCGVEITTKKCPLCSYNVKQDLKIKTRKDVSKKAKRELTPREKMVIFDVSTWFFVILVALVTLTVDIIAGNGISWSIYPIIPVVTYGIITSISINIKGYFKVVSIFIVVLLMLFSLDFYIPGGGSTKISAPVAVFTSLISLIIVLLFKKSRRKGANIAGYIIIGVAFTLIFVELLIRFTLDIPLRLSWSLITGVVLIPVALFLLYIHYNLSKKVNLKKVFHT